MAQKATRHAAAKRRRNNVTPIAVKTTAGSNAAVIPVTVETTGHSPEAEALIPVEVQNPTGKSVKRAARVPVRVRAAAKSQKTSRHVRSARNRRTRSQQTGKVRHRTKHQQKQRSQPDVVARSLMRLTDVEETAVNLVGGVSKIAVDWLQLALSVPFKMGAKAAERAKGVYSEASEAVEELYSEASDAVEELAA